MRACARARAALLLHCRTDRANFPPPAPRLQFGGAALHIGRPKSYVPVNEPKGLDVPVDVLAKLGVGARFSRAERDGTNPRALAPRPERHGPLGLEVLGQ